MKRIAVTLVKAIALCALAYIGLVVALLTLNVFFVLTGTLGNEKVDHARLLGQFVAQGLVLWLVIWLFRKVLRIGRKAPTVGCPPSGMNEPTEKNA